jgi:hypothetical protein
MNRLMIAVIALAMLSLVQDVTPPPLMAADATPGFEVATIEPSVPDGRLLAHVDFRKTILHNPRALRQAHP